METSTPEAIPGSKAPLSQYANEVLSVIAYLNKEYPVGRFEDNETYIRFLFKTGFEAESPHLKDACLTMMASRLMAESRTAEGVCHIQESWAAELSERAKFDSDANPLADFWNTLMVRQKMVAISERDRSAREVVTMLHRLGSTKEESARGKSATPPADSDTTKAV